MFTPDSSGTAFWLIPDDIKKIEKPVHQPASPTISASQLKDDIKFDKHLLDLWDDIRLTFTIRMLETGAFSDCTVTSRDQTWATHKVILSRCPYFACAFSSSNGFKEAVESRITIENFEPFEVSWLLQYIYGLRIGIEDAQETSPNKSFLETCALLWDIGDFFRLTDLSQFALTKLYLRCRTLLLQTRYLSTMLKKIEFLPDLEAGIRAAWRNDRVASPVRLDILSLCVGIHPFVKGHESFIGLLDEIPHFTAQYLKALLGCPGMQRVESRVARGIACCSCRQPILDKNGKRINGETFIWTPTSLYFRDSASYWFCSRACYNAQVPQRIL